MRSTINTLCGGTVGVVAGEHGELVALGVRGGGSAIVEALALTTAEAALLAGELERAVWAVQRQAEAHRVIPSNLRGGELMAAAVAAQAAEDAGYGA